MRAHRPHADRPRAARRGARAPTGTPRGSYAALFARVGPDALVAERERIRRRAARPAASSSAALSRATFDVDPVPRIIEAEEWERLERGLIQRARGAQRLPRRRLRRAPDRRRGVCSARADRAAPSGSSRRWRARGCRAVRAHVAGPDLVRGADGELRVLEDNLRAPSGLAYALAAREAMAPLIEASGLRAAPARAPGSTRSARCSAAAAPDGAGRPARRPAQRRRRRERLSTSTRALAGGSG